MKKATIKTVFAIILMLVPLCVSAIHIYKPITYELHMKLFDALSEAYYFFTFFGGIYYALVSLFFLGEKLAIALIGGLSGILLYHTANWFTYFCYAKVDAIGSGLSGMVAGYHLLTFLLLFDIVRFAKSLKQRISEKSTEGNLEESGESIFCGKEKKRTLLKYGLSVYMLIWFGMIALLNKVSPESIEVAIMYAFVFIGYVLPLFHPFFLVALSCKTKKEGFFKAYMEMCILLLPYFLIFVVPLSFEPGTKWIIVAYEYMLTFILHIVVFLKEKRLSLHK